MSSRPGKALGYGRDFLHIYGLVSGPDPPTSSTLSLSIYTPSPPLFCPLPAPMMCSAEFISTDRLQYGGMAQTFSPSLPTPESSQMCFTTQFNRMAASLPALVIHRIWLPTKDTTLMLLVLSLCFQYSFSRPVFFLVPFF